MELRLIMARIVMRFDVLFASGEDGRALMEDTKDYFTLGLADFLVEFKPIK
jgi:cytochrome P450 family 628